jgi:hypothetical protein
MSNSQQPDLNIRCIFSCEVSRRCFSFGDLSHRGGSSITYYTLLISLGILRWSVKRELNQLNILNQTLKVPNHISRLLPAKSLVKQNSARVISTSGQKLSMYLKQLAHHPCAVDANFVIFATSRMKIYQFYVVKGCSREDLSGIYVYKEHQGKFAKYEKFDNPRCVLINKSWLKHAGWYLVHN